MEKYITHSRSETEKAAADFAKRLKPGDIVAFFGGLGAGKTAFTGGIAKGLGMECEVTSPTFTICNEYTFAEKVLLHYDMYRVESWGDLYSTAFFDAIDSGAYIVVEWAENIFNALPDGCYIVEISTVSENEREIKIYLKGEQSQC
ncbi:MAG: tRNA (adenosine(37)-N6)-threonylcarbamoyltransferase complex ATPase subunit type 1 TsaE [Clostridiales bacterium]|nr:tRNA (adenosine(37)-N6)-threonylcarbamoyltransferase complex ATPase subunit type 1 TsaE [Clostridiales bacterium]